MGEASMRKWLKRVGGQVEIRVTPGRPDGAIGVVTHGREYLVRAHPDQPVEILDLA